MGKWKHNSTHFFTSALDKGEWLASSLSRCDPETHLIGDLVGPRVGLDGLLKIKSLVSIEN